MALVDRPEELYNLIIANRPRTAVASGDVIYVF